MEKRQEPVIVQVPSMKLFHVVVVVILVVGAFFLGSLWTKVEFLKGGSVAGVQQAAQPTGTTQQAEPKVTLDTVKQAFAGSLIKFGDANKKLLLIEVADPSCPYCHASAGHNGALNKQMGDRFVLTADGGPYVAPVPEIKKLVDSGSAAFAYLYTPGHGNGEMGTKAFYCAFEKGKFWDVHDKLMTSEGYSLLNDSVKNDKTKSEEVAQFLKDEFNPQDMKSCLDSGKYDARLGEDIALARSIGVSGTPGFFVNATAFAGAYSWKDMESAVNAAL